MGFNPILMGRQSCQKLQCLYGNLMANNFFQIEFHTTNQNVKTLSFKYVAWLEDAHYFL